MDAHCPIWACWELSVFKSFHPPVQISSMLLSEDTNTSLFKGLSGGLSGMPEVSLDMDTPFPLEEELQIEPLSLDGLNMLSDSSMGLLDPSVEETFRADRL